MDTDILLAALAAVFDVVSPIVIQWRKAKSWSKVWRVALPVLAALVIAVAYLVATDALTGQGLLQIWLTVFGLQQLVYGAIIKHIAALQVDPGKKPGELAGKHEA